MQGEDKKEDKKEEVMAQTQAADGENTEEQKQEKKPQEKKAESKKAELKKTGEQKNQVKKKEASKAPKMEKVQIKGRSPIWYWAFLIVGNAIFLHQLIFNRNNTESLVFGLVAVNLVFLPIVIKNVVEIDNETVWLKMGFFKEKISLSSVREVKRKPSKIFKHSPSHEKLIIKGKDRYVMVAVKEKDRLISELQKRKKNIKIDI